MPTLEIEIVAGPTNCAKEPGVWCQFLRARWDGSAPTCALFGASLWDADGDKEGWLRRCAECLEAERGG